MHYPNKPNIIDIEASGFGVESYPIEIGVALSSGSRFCTLVTPADPWSHWDEGAEQLHHISRDSLIAHGRPVDEVARTLNDLLQGITVYSDGWVVDKPWMTKLFAVAGVEMNFHVSPLELILSEQQMIAWHETKESVVTDAKIDRHRASNDAWVIQQTYWQTSNDS